MAVRTQFKLNGFDEYLENIARAGVDVDESVAEALEESGDVLLDQMQIDVPKDEHNLENHLERTPATRAGNFTFVEVGMQRGTDADTARYGNAWEYGFRRGDHFYIKSYIRAPCVRNNATC